MEISQIIAGRSASDIITCDVNTRVVDAVKLLASKRIGAVPVMRDGMIAGIFSERDVLYRLAEEGDLCLSRSVADIMTDTPITVQPETRVDEALGLMTRRRIRHLPVIHDGALIAFISIGDLVKTRIDEVEREAEAIRTYIQTA